MAAQDPKKSKKMFESLKSELVGELGKLVKEGPDAESWGVILEKVESKVFNADTALERTNAKFTRRFNHIEARAKEKGLSLKDMTLEQMEELWNEAKAIERQENPQK